MHGYCTSDEIERRRKKIIGVLVLLSAILTPLFNSLIQMVLSLCRNNAVLNYFVNYLNMKSISISISYVAVFGFLFWFVNRFFYLPILSKITGMPDVRGKWKGVLHSNYNGGTDMQMTLKIKQSWMKLQCVAIFERSSSNSIMGRIYQSNDDEIKLEFAFCNTSQDPGVIQQNYYGFNFFTIRGNKMTGIYFTNRTSSGEVTTKGDMDLVRQSN